jgi:tetratricopeptide (TPR) repeat protein
MNQDARESEFQEEGELLWDRIQGFLRGELTLAELEGMSWDDAAKIAEAGCELAESGRLEEARVLFEGLTGMNPRDAGAHAALGTVYQKLGRLPEALSSYSVAIELDPLHPVALAHRGELRLRAGDENGYRDLQSAVVSDPEGETEAGARAAAWIQALAQLPNRPAVAQSK